MGFSPIPKNHKSQTSMTKTGSGSDGKLVATGILKLYARISVAVSNFIPTTCKAGWDKTEVLGGASNPGINPGATIV